MAATQSLNVRMDPNLKIQAENILGELGIPTSTAITMFFKAIVRTGGIPFSLQINKLNAETIEAIEDVDNNRNLSRTFDSVEELMRDLDA